ncbi:uncharacterized protein LOC124336400 isoform X2 [Daphnia pulicaria]|uniref:uncharacterized protein LOC124336400 isoform X2 n=1 Tax=Daphnia pulicaria TaxID=35523 RepID=UPI001EEA3177|nr:uncharacterized protein LOC124336400 isoform X2 [Daphnia pulicaria]
MAFKNLVGAILAAVFLFLCCGAFLFGLVASQDAELGEQQASAQYYRPYYNYNRRPAYPVRRPTYNNYHYQRPQRPAAAPSNTNYRPAPAPTTSTARPSSAAVTGTSCRSSNSYQQYGICWAADNQRLQISPSLTIENFVRFHKMNMYSDVFDSHSYRKQLCEQSRRFNSVGVMCVTSPSDLAYDDDDCDYLRAGGVTTSTAKTCVDDDVCICVVGDPYESIADNTKAPNDPLNAFLSGTHAGTGYWSAWTAALNQEIQNTLAASGIYWRP